MVVVAVVRNALKIFTSFKLGEMRNISSTKNFCELSNKYDGVIGCLVNSSIETAGSIILEFYFCVQDERGPYTLKNITVDCYSHDSRNSIHWPIPNPRTGILCFDTDECILLESYLKEVRTTVNGTQFMLKETERELSL